MTMSTLAKAMKGYRAIFQQGETVTIVFFESRRASTFNSVVRRAAFEMERAALKQIKRRPK